MRVNYTFVGLMVAAVLVTGCTSVDRTSKRAMPNWYQNVDPAQDEKFIYFTGYSEASFSFSQARELAEQNARKRVAAYLGTQIMDELKQLKIQHGSDWSESIPPNGFLQQMFGDEMNAPSKKVTDIVRSDVTAYVNELVRRARTKDLYVETVTVTKGFTSYKRYDAGALLEFPRSEIERLDRQEEQNLQKITGLSRTAKQAEGMWDMGKKTEAIQLLQREIRKNPLNSELIVRLAQFQEEQGQTDSAIKNYMKVAEQEPANSEWGRLAQSRVAALSNVQLAGFLQLAQKYEGIAGGGLSDGLRWVQKGQTSRARKMFREKYESDSTAEADLWAWYLTAVKDSQGGSMAAEYDLSVSQKAIFEQIQTYQTAQQAMPAVITLLSFIRQGVEPQAAVEALWQIQKTLGATEFPADIGNMAVVALKDITSSKAQKVSRWLNNQES